VSHVDAYTEKPVINRMNMYNIEKAIELKYSPIFRFTTAIEIANSSGAYIGCKKIIEGIE